MKNPRWMALAADALDEVIADALRGGDFFSQQDIIALRISTAVEEERGEALARMAEVEAMNYKKNLGNAAWYGLKDWIESRAKGGE